MPQFHYHERVTMTPRPGRPYATVYIRQRPASYRAVREWLVGVAQAWVDAADQDPQMAQWMTQPLPEFKRTGGQAAYSPQDILEDMLRQVALERDLTEAMTGRWNRLTQGTPWQIEWVC